MEGGIPIKAEGYSTNPPPDALSRRSRLIASGLRVGRVCADKGGCYTSGAFLGLGRFLSMGVQHELAIFLERCTAGERHVRARRLDVGWDDVLRLGTGPVSSLGLPIHSRLSCGGNCVSCCTPVE